MLTGKEKIPWWPCPPEGFVSQVDPEPELRKVQAVWTLGRALQVRHGAGKTWWQYPRQGPRWLVLKAH